MKSHTRGDVREGDHPELRSFGRRSDLESRSLRATTRETGSAVLEQPESVLRNTAGWGKKKRSTQNRTIKLLPISKSHDALPANIGGNPMRG